MLRIEDKKENKYNFKINTKITSSLTPEPDPMTLAITWILVNNHRGSSNKDNKKVKNKCFQV